jgi:hypothetical protein
MSVEVHRTMHNPVRIRTTVLPGGRVDVADPQLSGREGQSVDVIVLAPPSQSTGETAGPTTVLDYLDRLPAGPRSARSWEQIEQQFRGERDSWDR